MRIVSDFYASLDLMLHMQSRQVAYGITPSLPPDGLYTSDTQNTKIYKCWSCDGEFHGHAAFLWHIQACCTLDNQWGNDQKLQLRESV